MARREKGGSRSGDLSATEEQVITIHRWGERHAVTGSQKRPYDPVGGNKSKKVILQVGRTQKEGGGHEFHLTSSKEKTTESGKKSISVKNRRGKKKEHRSLVPNRGRGVQGTLPLPGALRGYRTSEPNQLTRRHRKERRRWAEVKD